MDPCGQETQRSKIIDGDSCWSHKGKLLKYRKISYSLLRIVIQMISLVQNLKYSYEDKP